MNTLKYFLLAMVASTMLVSAEKPKVENKPWENACEGSDISVTSIAGKIVCIHAYVEHAKEGRQWVCLFKDGEIISAMYTHFTVNRTEDDESGDFTKEFDKDQVEVFHFPDHQLKGMDDKLKKDLEHVLLIAKGKCEHEQCEHGK